MRYRNTKTGAIFDSSCVVSGGDWALLEEEMADVLKDQESDKERREPGDKVSSEESKDKVSSEDTVDLSQMSVASLKKFAAEYGIDLGRATKRDDILAAIAASDAVEVE